MRPLRYAINITVDGCVDHTAGIPSAETHIHAASHFEWAEDAIFGRVIYQMMEAAWRPAAEGKPAEWVQDWMLPFAHAIAATKKHVVSSTLQQVDWNAELVRGGLEQTVRALKAQPGRGIVTGGVTLPLALARMGLIDEYEFVVQPRIAGRGPTLLAGLSKMVDLELVGRKEFSGGVIALQYVAKR